MRTFEKLSNTRDLGDLKLSGISVKKNRLIRSGQLFFASEGDLETLSNIKVRNIIDFRSTREKKEKPDPSVKGSTYLHLPVFDESKQGITREEKGKSAFEELLESLDASPDGAIRYMTRTYTDFITDSFALGQYSRFLEVLAGTKEGATLWHCTAGKDRAGFASILILEILGAEREEIIRDYLLTNDYLKDEISDIFRMLGPVFSGRKIILEAFFSAREEYVNALYEKIDEEYGSVDAFLSEKLGISSKMREKLKKMYLE